MRDWLLEDPDRDDIELTEDEQYENDMLMLEWADANNAWVMNGQKCVCGEPISLVDFYHHGCCLECLKKWQEEIPF